MESLGKILNSLTSIPSTSKLRRTSESEESQWVSTQTPSKDPCHLCHGTEWLSIGGPLTREYVPCPCQGWEEKHAAKRVQWANLPDGLPRTFENFQLVPGTEEAVFAARQFAETDCTHHILTLTGGYGSGKTHLLEALGRRMLESGRYVRYEYVPLLLDNLRATYEEDAEVKFTERWAMYTRAQVLLLDDLGAEKTSEWAAEKLTALVAERYRTGGRLVVATNLDFEQMSEKVGNRIADRLWDEHTGKVHAVAISAPSYRTGRSWGVPKRR